jgi:Rps23 Pro-64 3,4-dihydroxylase Tpa1-like proline 4-hydroxylase
MMPTPDFSLARLSDQPFSHAWLPRLFTGEANESIYAWLESELPWRHVRTRFYEQYEFSFKDVVLPAELRFLASRQLLQAIGDWLAGAFQSDALHPVDVVVHCLYPGQKIGIHNDYIKGGETHRLLLQFGKDVEGGETLLFEQMDARSLRRIIRPVFGTAFAFAITPHSYHAVSRILQGKRFTVIYSYRRLWH